MVIIAEFFGFYKRVCTFFPEKLFLFKTPTRPQQAHAAPLRRRAENTPLGGFTNKFAKCHDIRDFTIVIFLSFRC